MREDDANSSAQPGDKLDMAQFHELFVEHQRKIYKHIFALLPRPADAEDVFQNTCLTLLRKADQFTPGTSFLNWATKIARYETYNYRRGMQADKLQFSSSTLEAIATEQVAASDESQARRDAMRGCVAKLKPADRDLIVERYSSGVSADELAARLDRSAHSVRKSIRRVRAALRDCIERTLLSWRRPS